jgi:hypothetical protein
MYFVTFETFHGQKPGPAGISTGPQPRGFDLEGALAQARQLLAEGNDHVKITNGEGREISGADLVACCEGTKNLTADLRAT